MTELEKKVIEIETEISTCSECSLPAEYVRITQFAGKHPYCKTHAMKEKDFMKNLTMIYL